MNEVSKLVSHGQFDSKENIMAGSSTIREAIDKLGDKFGNLDPTLNWMIPRGAYSQDPMTREEIIVRYTVGTGRFNRDKTLNVLIMEMFRMDGSRDGSHTGVWQPVSPPESWFDVPPKPEGPLDKPEVPVHPT